MKLVKTIEILGLQEFDNKLNELLEQGYDPIWDTFRVLYEGPYEKTCFYLILKTPQIIMTTTEG